MVAGLAAARVLWRPPAVHRQLNATVWSKRPRPLPLSHRSGGPPQRRAQTSKTTPSAKPSAKPSPVEAEQAPGRNLLPPPGPPKDDPIPIANNVSPLPLWQRLGPLTWAADSYARAQRRRPYVTQLFSAIFIAFCADMTVQRMNRHRADYDPKRTVRSLAIGAISAIPTYKWFMFLSHSFNYASRALSIATKVTVNQICYTPVFNSYFFGMQAFLAGASPLESWERVKKTVPTSMVNSVKVWPAVTTFSFMFVPMEYRSVFAGVIAVFWQTYLMYLNRKAEDASRASVSVENVNKVAYLIAAPTTPASGQK